MKHIKVPGKRSTRTNIIAALTNKGIEAPFTFEGSCDGKIFETYVEDVLCPVLRPGQVVIMDNASFHKSKRIREVIEQAKCALIYLSPYSPELNPIEHYWAVLKKQIKMMRKVVNCFDLAVEQAIICTLGFGQSCHS
jgi:transposase